MANNYLQFSMAFKLTTDAEKNWCAETMQSFTALIANDFNTETTTKNKLAKKLGALGQRAIEEEWETCGFEWSVDPIETIAAD